MTNLRKTYGNLRYYKDFDHVMITPINYVIIYAFPKQLNALFRPFVILFLDFEELSHSRKTRPLCLSRIC